MGTDHPRDSGNAKNAMAVTAISTDPDAGAYVNFLKSPTAKPAFEKQGFAVLQ
jgi:ABC-type molybdate transport system substrate-binding protein